MDNGYLGVEDFTVQRIANIITDFACWLIGIVLAVMVIFLIIAGVRFFLAKGNDTAVADAKKNLTWTLVGILVILATNVIIATVANALGGDYSFIPLNCSFAPPSPDSLTCSPENQSVNQGQGVNFSASKGEGGYSWSAPGGSPSSGSGSSFTTTFSTVGSKTVTVTSSGESASCMVEIFLSEAEPPVITSFAPDATTAGVGNFNQETAAVTFNPLYVPFEVEGENLKNAIITSDNIGLNNKQGINFESITTSDTLVKGFMIIEPAAKEGITTITLATSGGSDNAELTVNITGTQYLQRRFKDKNVAFFGDWPNLMPDEEVLELESLVSRGLQEIKKPNYRMLGIISNIYEESYFVDKKICPSGALSNGCAARDDNIILIRGDIKRTDEGIPGTMVHESAHKLHFYNNGEYKLIPRAKTNFENEWKSVLGNLNLCPHLPLKTVDGHTTWSDGIIENQGVPRCGFIWAYGAYNVDIGEVFEDVATFEEAAHFGFSNNLPDDQRYQLKKSLLKNYGF